MKKEIEQIQATEKCSFKQNERIAHLLINQFCGFTIERMESILDTTRKVLKSTQKIS